MRIPSRSVSFGSLAVLLAACGAETPTAPLIDDSLYALVEGVDGVHFYPPLGPEVTAADAFDATLVDGLSVTVESVSATGELETLATFDRSTTPAVALIGPRERYFVDIPAAAYVTDPTRTYQIRAHLDGNELGTSVLSSHVFTVLAHVPSLRIGVAVRVEGSAVRAAAPARRRGGASQAHCSDGAQNKDETGVDCGGSCAACCTPSAELCDGVDNDCNGEVDELQAPVPATGGAAWTNTTYYGCTRASNVTVTGASVAEIAARAAGLANSSGCGGNSYSVASADETTGVFTIACAGSGACGFGSTAVRGQMCLDGGLLGGACVCGAASDPSSPGGSEASPTTAMWTNTTYYGCTRRASVMVDGPSVAAIAASSAAIANTSGCGGNVYSVASANEATGAFTIACAGSGACGYGGVAVRLW
jgi:hypothetical protein